MDRLAFHRDCLVLDAHTDVPTRLLAAPADLSQRLADRHVDLPRLREGGVDAVVFALYVPARLSPEAGLAHALELHRLAAEQLAAGGLEQVWSAAELRRAVERGAVAVLMALENGRPLLLPGAIERVAGLGVRYVTLTHVATHEWCDASGDEARHGGLSADGVRIVRRLAALGILTDVSHVSDAAVRHVLDVSPAPVVASHSSARALCDHPRNLPDELVREIARAGGVVMANTYPAFVDPAACRVNDERLARLLPRLTALEEELAADPPALAAAADELFAGDPLPPVPLAAYVDHLIHLVELGGEEHVGIGTDLDGIPDTLVGFEDASCFPALTEALLDRGVDPAGVRLILGENFLRLLSTLERLAD